MHSDFIAKGLVIKLLPYVEILRWPAGSSPEVLHIEQNAIRLIKPVCPTDGLSGYFFGDRRRIDLHSLVFRIHY